MKSKLSSPESRRDPPDLHAVAINHLLFYQQSLSNAAEVDHRPSAVSSAARVQPQLELQGKVKGSEPTPNVRETAEDVAKGLTRCETNH